MNIIDYFDPCQGEAAYVEVGNRSCDTIFDVNKGYFSVPKKPSISSLAIVAIHGHDAGGTSYEILIRAELVERRNFRSGSVTSYPSVLCPERQLAHHLYAMSVELRALALC